MGLKYKSMNSEKGKETIKAHKSKCENLHNHLLSILIKLEFQMMLSLLKDNSL